MLWKQRKLKTKRNKKSGLTVVTIVETLFTSMKSFVQSAENCLTSMTFQIEGLSSNSHDIRPFDELDEIKKLDKEIFHHNLRIMIMTEKND